MTVVSRKVSGGKYVEVEVSDGDVEVYGDFFMHPENEIEGIEDVLEERLETDAEEIEEGLQVYLEENDVELLGADPGDVAELTVKARDQNEDGGEAE
ncbi:MAG: hypothetical protein ABEK59_00020 [Halobacteria archaeon]